MTKYECTQKVKKRIQLSTKDEVAKEIGISRPTLDARLSFHSWKVSEIYLISTL
jgi:predicted DNA binding protein